VPMPRQQLAVGPFRRHASASGLALAMAALGVLRPLHGGCDIALTAGAQLVFGRCAPEAPASACAFALRG
jgi:hypothetical protein